MIQKEAGIGQAAGSAWKAVKGFGGRALAGAQQIGEGGLKPIKGVGEQMAGRFEELSGAGVGKSRAALEALRTGAGTNVGGALAAGAGGLAAGGAGLTGLGYMAGRGRRLPPPPPR